MPGGRFGRYDAGRMSFFRRHRVPVVLVALGVLVAVLVGYQIKKQQAAAVPRRQLEIVVGVVKPIVKDLDVKLAYTATDNCTPVKTTLSVSSNEPVNGTGDGHTEPSKW